MTGGTRTPKANGQRGGGKPPVDSKTRARIERAARKAAADGSDTRNGIARKFGVSGYTVTKISREAKPPILWDRAATAAATEAKVLDAKARRIELSESVLTSALDLVGRLTAQHEVIHWDKDGMMHRGTIDKPTSADVKNYAIAIGILTDKHTQLQRFDTDDRDLAAVDAWLASLGGTPIVVAA